MISAAFIGPILRAPTGRTVRTSPSSDSTRTCSPGKSASPPVGAGLPQLPVHVDEPVLADLADRAGDELGPDLNGPVPYLPGLASANAQTAPSATATPITSGFDVWYGAGAFWNSMIEPTARQTSPASGQRAVCRHVHVHDQQRNTQEHQQHARPS